MIQFQDKFIVRFSWFLMFFIALQPVLDVLTSISIQSYESTVTVGIVVRVLVMLFALIYILCWKHSKLKKVALIYLSTILLIIGIGFVTAWAVKPNFQLFAEGQYYAKTFYFPVMFISYIMAMIVLRDHTKKNIITIFLTPIVVSMTLIGVVYLVAIMTGTGLDTYKFVKAGTKAWFHAGNEIGAILSICLPVILLYGIRLTKNVAQLIYWIPALLVIFSLVMLGTKVGYLAIIISLGMALFAIVVSQLFTKQPNLKPSLVIISVLLAGVLLSTPYTPAFSNTETHIRIIDEITGEVEEPMPEAPEVVTDEDAGVLKRYSNRIINILLSSRQIFLKNTHEMFVEAPLVQKLFGMGYAGNYPERPKLIEMDFLDLFYSYGIIGSIIYMLPIFYAVVLLLKNVRHNFEKLLQVEFLLVFSSLFLGFAIALIAGHVLFAPAVSIYLAVLGSAGTVLLLPHRFQAE